MANRLILTAGFIAILAACGAKSKNDDGDAYVPGPGFGNGAGSGTGSDATAVVALTLGTEVEAKGDVLQDENGLFSLTRTYTLTLAAETSLAVRKLEANGNCGAPNGTFVFFAGEQQVADVTIDHTKNYGGVPKEALAVPLAAGTYTVIGMFTLEQECKDMMFYYDFVVEAAP